jgi:modulator of FtsH protease
VALAAAVLPWHDFYALLGAVAATLVGLLFVAITFNIERFRGREGETMFMLAERTFGAFLVLIAIALVMLIPFPSADGIVPTLMLAGFLGASRTITRSVRAWRHARSRFVAHFLRRDLLLILSYGALLYAGLSIFGGDDGALYFLIGPILGLLLMGLYESWNLLLVFREEAAESAPSGVGRPVWAAKPPADPPRDVAIPPRP